MEFARSLQYERKNPRNFLCIAQAFGDCFEDTQKVTVLGDKWKTRYVPVYILYIHTATCAAMLPDADCRSRSMAASTI